MAANIVKFEGSINQAVVGDVYEAHSAAIKAESGSTVHVHLPQCDAIIKQNAALNHLVSRLMKICTDGHCKEEIEKISITLYGISLFKNLQLEQIATLQKIAEVIQIRTLRDIEKQEKTNALLVFKEQAISTANKQLEPLQQALEIQTQRANFAVKGKNQPCIACEQKTNKLRIWKWFFIGILLFFIGVNSLTLFAINLR